MGWGWEWKAQWQQGLSPALPHTAGLQEWHFQPGIPKTTSWCKPHALQLQQQTPKSGTIKHHLGCVASTTASGGKLWPQQTPETETEREQGRKGHLYKEAAEPFLWASEYFDSFLSDSLCKVQQGWDGWLQPQAIKSRALCALHLELSKAQGKSIYHKVTGFMLLGLLWA